MRYYLSLLLLCTFCVFASEHMSGKYEAVSESEWALSLVLNEDGTAIIEISSWVAGEYINRETQVYKGIWSHDGNIVSVSYNGITETLLYSETLSLSELGKSGGSPGLKGQAKPWDKGVIGSSSLWLSTALKEIYE